LGKDFFDVLTEFLNGTNLVYILPIALVGVMVILRRVGFEVDFAGALDALFGDERKRETRRAHAVWRFFFPAEGLAVLRAGLFAFGWATTGLTLNHVTGTESPWSVRGLIFVVACVVGFWLSVLGARLFHFLLPTENDTTQMEDLVGRSATVISDQVDAHHGRVRVIDAQGNAITVFCRLVGEGPAPQTGSHVTLVAYHPADRTFDVMP